MQAVHAARRFPVILPMLAEGLLHLTAVRLLAPHLRDEDHLALLCGAVHKSKREVVRLLAGWFPSEDVPTSIRKLPTAARSASRSPETAALPLSCPVQTAAAAAVAGPAPAVGLDMPATGASTPVSPTAPASVVAPLSAERFRLQVTMSSAAHDDLRWLQDALRREIPDGDAAAIVARALRALRGQVERRAFSATSRPRAVGPAASDASRHIPAAVQRAVWQRDRGQCAFEGALRRCEERSLLEFHHVKPWIVGGPPSVANIALRCRAHNAYEATVYFAPIQAGMDEMAGMTG
jgi:hypothetical protein